MDEAYFQTNPALYFPYDIPINAQITITDIIISVLFAAVMLTVMTIVLDRWVKEEIKEMEKESRLLEHRLLKMGIALKTTPI